jgi:UDP-GlcNAc3NAcA epimerase
MPEEINRILTDHMSDLLFAPTETAVSNLRKEGIPSNRLFLTGDVMYDAALYYGAKAERESRILTRIGLLPKQYVMATVHRAENTDDGSRLKAIFRALMEVALEVPVVVPLHPRTHLALERIGIWEESRSLLKIIEPVGYLDMILLERNARAVVTDSGGVQKEAFFYGVPCITLRDETEWVELVGCGWNRIASPSKGPKAIVENVRNSLTMERSPRPSFYGEGNAAQRILAALEAAFLDRQSKLQPMV